MGFSLSGAVSGASMGYSMGPWGALAGGALGGFMGGSGSSSSAGSSAYDVNQMMLDESQRNRDFQLMMSSTAHQREVEDLRKAGLNPILSATGGAPMGSGSTATGFMNPGEKDYQQNVALAAMKANTAKILSEAMLNKSLIKTEASKQRLNEVTADRTESTVGVPGLLQTSGKKVGEWWKNQGEPASKAVGNLIRNVSSGKTQFLFADK